MGNYSVEELAHMDRYKPKKHYKRGVNRCFSRILAFYSQGCRTPAITMDTLHPQDIKFMFSVLLRKRH
jgi:hypothetical protein